MLGPNFYCTCAVTKPIQSIDDGVYLKNKSSKILKWVGVSERVFKIKILNLSRLSIEGGRVHAELKFPLVKTLTIYWNALLRFILYLSTRAWDIEVTKQTSALRFETKHAVENLTVQNQLDDCLPRSRIDRPVSEYVEPIGTVGTPDFLRPN